MHSIDDVGTETVLSGTSDWITPDLAEVLAAHPIDCVDTAYPHAVWEAKSPDMTVRPSEDHPVFYGCFDWHSAVHSHWSLLRQRRLIDDHPRESDIVESVQRRFTADNVAREVAYLRENPTFEKPYGWAWCLRLAAELRLGDRDDWQAVFRPLETRVVDLVRTEFLTQDRPFRVGTHHNSAFALQCVVDYARTAGNESLEAATRAQARGLFLDDTDAPVEYEPFGWDFLSPALAELDLMRRVLDHEAFVDWMEAFLPDVTTAPHGSILQPVSVDRAPDEDIALHLVGLNLSKAWCLAGLADSLDGHRYAEVFERAAHRHVENSLSRAFTDAYAGSHWLSSFVLYLVTRNEGGIAP